jgi:hypothetical protein
VDHERHSPRPTGPPAKLRGRYELVSASTPTVTVEYSSDQDAGAFTALTVKGEQGGATGWGKSDGSRYQWANVAKRRDRIRFRFTLSGAATSLVWRAVELHAFTPFQPPADPGRLLRPDALDAQRGAAVAWPDEHRAGHRARRPSSPGEDYGLDPNDPTYGYSTVGQINLGYNRDTADLSTQRTYEGQDYDRNVQLLTRQYQQQGRQQAEQARKYGVTSGGIALLSAAKRNENQAIDRQGIDTAHTRAVTGFDTTGSAAGRGSHERARPGRDGLQPGRRGPWHGARPRPVRGHVLRGRRGQREELPGDAGRVSGADRPGERACAAGRPACSGRQAERLPDHVRPARPGGQPQEGRPSTVTHDCGVTQGP